VRRTWRLIVQLGFFLACCGMQADDRRKAGGMRLANSGSSAGKGRNASFLGVAYRYRAKSRQ
jgi:hypothetical protein